jgi:hypothetical protein
VVGGRRGGGEPLAGAGDEGGGGGGLHEEGGGIGWEEQVVWWAGGGMEVRVLTHLSEGSPSITAAMPAHTPRSRPPPATMAYGSLRPPFCSQPRPRCHQP